MQLHCEVLEVKTSISELWEDTDQPITKSIPQNIGKLLRQECIILMMGKQACLCQEDAVLPHEYIPMPGGLCWLQRCLLSELLFSCSTCHNSSVYWVLSSSDFCFSLTDRRNSQEMEQKKNGDTTVFLSSPDPVSALDPLAPGLHLVLGCPTVVLAHQDAPCFWVLQTRPLPMVAMVAPSSS